MKQWPRHHGPRLSRSLLNLRPSRPRRAFSAGRPFLEEESSHDPRIRDLGRRILDDYAVIRENYATPKHPIVLAHGLLGFSELKVAPYLPAIEYWHGIKQALVANKCSVVTTSVPPSGSIEERAEKLAADILAQNQTPMVNIIAHSMGGLDARYMISRLQPAGIKVASLVTIATPHRGSPFADYLVESDSSPVHLPRLYSVIRRAGLGTSAFGQLTTRYMRDEFNPRVPDDPAVRYFSYGAMIDEPSLLGAFRVPYGVVKAAEGENDGLVSVASSRWGVYKGTLVGVSHLDLINWSNRARWAVREWMGMRRNFNAVAFYLDVADMLAKEGL
ncbi:alpha/beta-hydrolase [Trichoderma citrinoviride]|uniref:GPI inositol-deacylase n=1 Tax=Trichoderma citrinoviride TaxID=58853 RepID=A0A2T4BL42_9HYPO|nr:alpha/beta-hydrolase [Trichoderma citrinoviride]PTB69990.1 alpha/beta-hydrolase [Trichoderma citrinoviride]